MSSIKIKYMRWVEEGAPDYHAYEETIFIELKGPEGFRFEGIEEMGT